MHVTLRACEQLWTLNQNIAVPYYLLLHAVVKKGSLPYWRTLLKIIWQEKVSAKSDIKIFSHSQAALLNKKPTNSNAKLKKLVLIGGHDYRQ